MRTFKLLFVFALVCKIFEFCGESPGGCTSVINEWLKDKKAIVKQTQSSTDTRTLITITAEDWSETLSLCE